MYVIVQATSKDTFSKLSTDKSYPDHNPLPDPLYSISPLDNNHFAPPRRSTTLPNPQMHHTLLGHDRNREPFIRISSPHVDADHS